MVDNVNYNFILRLGLNFVVTEHDVGLITDVCG